MMGYLARIAVFVCSFTIAALGFAAEPSTRTVGVPADIRFDGVLRGGPAQPVKAAGDTARLIGPASLDPLVIGTFETTGGAPAWNGWTSVDWTAPDTTFGWHASDYYAVSGGYSAYCGDETIPSCYVGDPVGGYGNDWDKFLAWRTVVADPGAPTAIDLTAVIDVDSEAGYDYATIERELPGDVMETLWSLSGDSTATAALAITYTAGQYVGDNADEVAIFFHAESDGGFSDVDCFRPGTGLVRVDDVSITCDNPALVVGHDFEDGTLGPFVPHHLPGVGDFARIRANLGDADICANNLTPQVVFIDDGIVQPATGGSPATSPDRAYAGGWVVNYTGGLTFDSANTLRNAVVSPVVPWPEAGHDGLLFAFTTYLDNHFMTGETGVFMEWQIRSTDGDAASIADEPWIHSPFFYEGGPAYYRRVFDVSEYLLPGRTHVQVALGVRELDYVWGLDGDNGTPAPYIDNVRLESHPFAGPAVSATVYQLAQDAFPEIGEIDTNDLGRNHIRFDMARNIVPAFQESYRNGDSLVIDVVPVRAGAALTARPRFHYKLRRNPLFDPYRTSGLPDSGVIVMDTTFTPTGYPVNDRYRVDLPDTGFIFPGDVLHYYFSAEDAIGGPGGTAPLTTTLPKDLTWWGDFTDFGSHEVRRVHQNDDFTMRGLPTVFDDPDDPGTFICPPVLLWDDAASEGRSIEVNWTRILMDDGLAMGETYDRYYTKGPSVRVGSGLGSRATVAQLDWYGELVYHCGELNTVTLSNGDWDLGGSDDLGLLEGWLDLGGKDLFLSGDNLAYDLTASGPQGADFLRDRMMVTFAASTHRDLLGGQLAPRVLVGINPVFATVSSWIAYGGCPQLRNFDLVVSDGGERLAVWADATGVDGGYPYSPATLAVHGNGSRVISMTMDLAHVQTDANEGAKADAVLAVRSRMFVDIINYFGLAPHGGHTEVPGAGAFAVSQRPNPFNPVTEIAYTVQSPGHLTLKVYSLRGGLVRTLIDGRVEQSGKVAWDGTDSRGGQVASGVYFYEARLGAEVRIGKMALIK